MIVIENVKILLENERLEEGKIQRKGLVTYPITAPPQKGAVAVTSFSLKEWTQLEESSDSAY